MCHRFLVPPKVTKSKYSDFCLKGGRVETRKPAGGGAALKLIFRRGGGGRSCSARFIFTLSPSKSPQYPPKGSFSHCQVHICIARFIFTLSPTKSPQYPPKSKSERETACVQSMFPAFKRFRLKPCYIKAFTERDY